MNLMLNLFKEVGTPAVCTLCANGAFVCKDAKSAVAVDAFKDATVPAIALSLRYTDSYDVTGFVIQPQTAWFIPSNVYILEITNLNNLSVRLFSTGLYNNEGVKEVLPTTRTTTTSTFTFATTTNLFKGSAPEPLFNGSAPEPRRCILAIDSDVAINHLSSKGMDGQIDALINPMPLSQLYPVIIPGPVNLDVLYENERKNKASSLTTVYELKYGDALVIGQRRQQGHAIMAVTMPPSLNANTNANTNKLRMLYPASPPTTGGKYVGVVFTLQPAEAGQLLGDRLQYGDGKFESGKKNFFRLVTSDGYKLVSGPYPMELLNISTAVSRTVKLKYSGATPRLSLAPSGVTLDDSMSDIFQLLSDPHLYMDKKALTQEEVCTDASEKMWFKTTAASVTAKLNSTIVQTSSPLFQKFLTVGGSVVRCQARTNNRYNLSVPLIDGRGRVIFPYTTIPYNATPEVLLDLPVFEFHILGLRI